MKTIANLSNFVVLGAAVLTLGTTSAHAALKVDWDFSLDDTQGWTVLNGEANFQGDGVNAGHNGGNYAHDATHQNFILASPAVIKFAGAHPTDTLVEITWQGGSNEGAAGGAEVPGSRADVLSYNGGNSNANGGKGVAFYNLTTGDYDYIHHKATNDGADEITALDLATLTGAGVNQTDTYQLDFFEHDDGGWGWSRLRRVQLDETVVVPAALLGVVWDFDDGAGGDHGWTAVNGFASFAPDGVHASQDGANFAEENSHENLIFRSPIVNFGSAADDDPVIEVDFIGGQGNQSGSPDPADSDAVVAYNGGNSDANGQKGLAFLNMDTGNYDHVLYDSADGDPTPDSITLTKAELAAAGIDTAADYRLDFIETDDRTWGWTRLESVSLNAVVVPPPPPPPGNFTVVWDFSTDDTQGWTVVNGEPSFEGDGVNAGQTGGGFAHDAAHEVFLLRSPIISFRRAMSDGASVVEIDWQGGTGNQGGSVAPPAGPADLLSFNGGGSASNGLKGIGFLNLTTGLYDYISHKAFDGGGVETTSFSLGSLLAAGVNQKDDYQLDFFEADDGNWGWSRLRGVRLDALLDPAPLSNIQLTITESGGDLDIEWPSQPGKLYNLRSETDPSNGDPIDWPVYDGNTDMPATPPTNLLSFDLPADPERFFVVEEFDAPPFKVFFDDFESGQGGWTTIREDEPPPALVSTTEWELGTPDPNLFGNPPAPFGGANCWGTDLDANYQEDTLVRLRSPPIDLSVVESASVTYQHWREIEVMFDRATVRLLDAANLSEIAILADDIDGSSGAWEEVTHELPAEANGKTVILEFVLDSDNFGNQSGFFLDDICVFGPPL